MITVVFWLRVRDGVEEGELLPLAQKMYELGSSMPGFLSFKQFQAEDGEYIYIVEFESEEALAAWRDHPEHQEAQQRGREEFFSEYRVQICQPIREYRFGDGQRQEVKLSAASGGAS